MSLKILVDFVSVLMVGAIGYLVLLYRIGAIVSGTEESRWKISRQFLENLLIKSEERRKAGLSLFLTETNIACITQVCGILSIKRLSEILEGATETSSSAEGVPEEVP